MERIPGLDEVRIAEHQQEQHDAAALHHEDDDLQPHERRDREPVIEGTALKRGDDILIYDSIFLRVVGPGRGWNVLIGYYPDWFGDNALQFEISPDYITDRAPLDPDEPPMPVWPPPEPPVEPEALTPARAIKSFLRSPKKLQEKVKRHLRGK